VSPREGAVDGRGEDGLIDVDGESIPVQIVTLPPDRRLWNQVSRGRGHLAGEAPKAVALVRAAIQKKSRLDPSAKRCLWLVLDASKVGALCTNVLVGAYLGAHGDPAAEFGFAQVWIVGPTTGTTLPLGR
jgi:hypothetical protein